MTERRQQFIVWQWDLGQYSKNKVLFVPQLQVSGMGRSQTTDESCRHWHDFEEKDIRVREWQNIFVSNSGNDQTTMKPLKCKSYTGMCCRCCSRYFLQLLSLILVTITTDYPVCNTEFFKKENWCTKYQQKLLLKKSLLLIWNIMVPETLWNLETSRKVLRK